MTQMRHVGNAVPPLLSRALRDHVARDLLGAGVHNENVGSRLKSPRREDPTERSRVMRAVPSKNSSPELALRKALWSAGLRGYRLHSKGVPGNPDVVFPLARLALFVDGCFWHGCPDCYRAPKAHAEYWSKKVQRNMARDLKVTVQCEAAGWRVARIWEHEMKREPLRVVGRVMRALKAATIGVMKRSAAAAGKGTVS